MDLHSKFDDIIMIKSLKINYETSSNLFLYYM